MGSWSLSGLPCYLIYDSSFYSLQLGGRYLMLHILNICVQVCVWLIYFTISDMSQFSSICIYGRWYTVIRQNEALAVDNLIRLRVPVLNSPQSSPMTWSLGVLSWARVERQLFVALRMSPPSRVSSLLTRQSQALKSVQLSRSAEPVFAVTAIRRWNLADAHFAFTGNLPFRVRLLLLSVCWSDHPYLLPSSVFVPARNSTLTAYFDI